MGSTIRCRCALGSPRHNFPDSGPFGLTENTLVIGGFPWFVGIELASSSKEGPWRRASGRRVS